MSCSAILASGPHKGTQCTSKAKANGKCGRHVEKTTTTSKQALPDDAPYSGEADCEGVFASGKRKGTKCDRTGYYYDDGQVRCGVHSDKETRLKLRKKPIDAAEKKEHLEEIEAARAQNQKEGLCGDLKLYRMGMMKPVISCAGYINVFPNYRHANRTDGLGLATLSPMRLGPVEHGQPGLPAAETIEGFHQYSKWFAVESREQFEESRLQGYATKEPERRKFPGVPLYFVWLDQEGKEHHLDYVTSRQFYCNFYERLVLKEKEFAFLKELHESGDNLQICGYDGYAMGATPEGIEAAYLNEKEPFGHERVLLTMLLLEEGDYPWRKYKTFDF